MQITVTLEDKSPEDLFAQHLAEQMAAGHVEDWLYGLMYSAFRVHPDYRECPKSGCHEIVYPTFTVRPVADDSWKSYRVATAPTEHCPCCGTATVPPISFPPNEHIKEMNAAFAAGRSGIPDSVHKTVMGG